MAATSTFRASLRGASGSAAVTDDIQSSRTASGSKIASRMQALSTTPAAIDLGGCSNIGEIAIRNLDSAIDVTISLDNAAADVVSVIKPGCGILLQFPPSTIYAKSASGTPSIFSTIVEQ